MTQRQFAQIGRRTVGDNIALLNPVSPHLHQRTLVDAGVLVRTLEFAQRVDVDAGLAGFNILRCTDNDTCCVNLVNDTAAFGRNRSARLSRATVSSMPVPTKVRFGFHQRHRLTLHVRSHQERGSRHRFRGTG